MRKLLEAAPGYGIELRQEYDLPNTEPIVDAEHIQFNGAAGDGHETFYLQRALLRDFNFCKTARKPYDLVVCGVLIVAEKHAPGAWDIGSDGEFAGDDDEWTPAIEFVAKVLGSGYDVPPEVRRPDDAE